MGDQITLAPLDEAYAKGFSDGQDAIKNYAGDALRDAAAALAERDRVIAQAEEAFQVVPITDDRAVVIGAKNGQQVCLNGARLMKALDAIAALKQPTGGAALAEAGVEQEAGK